jgi:hypothetical protein
MVHIEDGKTNSVAAVQDNRLQVDAITETELVAAIENGDGYSWTCAYDYGAAETILLVKNTSSVENLHIDKIIMSSDTATLATIHCPTVAFTIAGAALVTGINFNRVSGKVALATAYQNESGNTQGAILQLPYLLTPNADYTINFNDSVIILGNGQSIGIDYTTAGTMARITIIGHYHILDY